jgi:hypothetical protein
MPTTKKLRDEAKYRILPPLDAETYAGLERGIGAMLGAVALVAAFALWWGWNWATAYLDYAPPYRWIAIYYYWLAVFPLSLPYRLFTTLTEPGVTPYANLNTVIGVVAYTAAMIATLWAILWLFCVVLGQRKPRNAAVYLFGPAACGIGYHLATIATTWLFATPPTP